MARRKTKKSSSQTRSVFRGTIKWLFVAGIWSVLVLGGVMAWYAQELPDITKKATFERKTSITVQAADGSVIARYGEMKGQNLGIEDLPENLVNAVLAIEDRRFYSHFGLDPVGLVRAFATNIKAGKTVQGGSTITQQLAKNLFLSQERTIKRKIQEALLALWLESILSKDEILSAYLNRVYLGSGTYGIDAAARLYFDKEPKDLDLRESAIIAGLLKAPSRYSPLSNPTLARQRADVVISAMEDAGFIQPDEADTLTGRPPRPSQKPGSPRDASRYFADWVVDGLDDLIGTPTDDLIIHTTLNPKIQNAAENALTGVINAHGAERKISQGAAVVMRLDGAVVALVGGADYSRSQFNRAVQARRQPGSSFKPVVYLTALEQGWTSQSLILDAPMEGRYRPQNFGNEYLGEVTLDTALTNSLNTAAVRLMQAVGPAPVVNMGHRLGIHSKLDENLSLALGSSTVSPLEMTAAYATLGTGGLAVYPYAITKITDKKGTLYYQRTPDRPTRRVVGESYVRELTGMMRHVVEYGTGRGAMLSVPVAGKTGTSQSSRDAWFLGFTAEMAAGVWLGNDDDSPMKGVTGGSFPAQIWRQAVSAGQGLYPAAPAFIFQAGQESGAPSAPSGFNSLLDRLIWTSSPSTGKGELEKSGSASWKREAPPSRAAPQYKYND
ncbi:MAG: PBP1A family penicillin-binding protein [Alphaproteobacteria bacterium]|nr:PBP1A family penicillin-binding protein [Alphaproteobacteria bacterium]